MQIVAAGINHKTAPVAVRERVTLLPEEVPAAVEALRKHVLEGAVLSTCNRTELYAIVDDADGGATALRQFFPAFHRISSGDLDPHIYAYSGHEAVRHLFAVASGIDSQILGETEILGQVREALVLASEAKAVEVPLSRLFHAALRTGRLVREQTSISRHAVSVSSAGVQLAKRVFGGLTHCRVLVISAGEAGSLAAKAIKDAGAGEIGVANRTRSKAEDLALEIGGRSVDFNRLPEALVDFDVVISATASARYVVSRGQVERAMAARGGRPLCLIDIAVPRDFDPETRSLPNVHLYDIDDLEAVSLLGLNERRKSVAQVERIIDGEVDRFMKWYSSLEVVPVVKALHRKAELVRKRELAKTLSKLDHLSEADKLKVEALSKAIAQKLIHDPILALKHSSRRNADIEAARDLFRLDGE